MVVWGAARGEGRGGVGVWDGQARAASVFKMESQQGPTAAERRELCRTLCNGLNGKGIRIRKEARISTAHNRITVLCSRN